MAALRHGIKTVIIPEDNAKDLEEIDQNVRQALNFITVSHADSVIETALDFSACRREAAEEGTSLTRTIPVPEQKKNKNGIRQ